MQRQTKCERQKGFDGRTDRERPSVRDKRDWMGRERREMERIDRLGGEMQTDQV